MPNTMKINDGVDARFVLANIAQMSDAAARPRLVQVDEVMMAQYERDVEALAVICAASASDSHLVEQQGPG